MNSDVDLRASRSLEIFGRLKQVAAKFAQREEQLTRELSIRRSGMNRKQREALGGAEEWQTKLIAELEERFITEEGRVRAFHEQRRMAIQQAHANSMQNLRVRAQHTKEKWLTELQLRHFKAEKALPADLKAADKAFADFAAQLGQQREAYAKLDKSAWNAFGGVGAFQKMLRRERKAPEGATEKSADHPALFAELQAHLRGAAEQLEVFRGFVLPKIFSFLPLPAVLPVVAVAGVVLALVLRGNPHGMWIAGGAVVVLLALVLVVHGIGLSQSKAAATALAVTLGKAVRAHDAAAAAATAHHASEHRRIKAEHDQLNEEIQQQWDRADEIEREFSAVKRDKLRAQLPRSFVTNEGLLAPKLTQLGADRRAQLAEVTGTGEARKAQVSAAHAAELAALTADETSRWSTLVADWQREVLPLHHAVEEMNAALAGRFPEWNSAVVEGWVPPGEFPPAVKFGRLEFGSESAPKDPRLALPGGPRVTIPLALAFPAEGSLLLATSDSSESAVVGTLNNVILRLLATTAPGKLSFTILDPVGLGQNFSGLMHLGDYEESLINRRIWTQRDQIEERLEELNEHIEKVIQMYLRNEFATITEYNAKAGSVAEKYHFLIVADFPASFSESAIKRLQSIATSGPRCGVFTLIHWDPRQPMPDGFVAEELRKHSVCLRREGNALIVHTEHTPFSAVPVLEPPPSPELAMSLVHKIGKASIDSNRVEVPFLQIAPKPEEMWTGDTTQELRVAVGRTGATKLQYLAIGKGTRQHALFAGKTGSGKSTLFHVIITNLALSCSPEQVEFYLIDFKKGVEFKCYATKRLPHARVVAIESDREFALSVLQRVDDELKRRGDIFRRLGVQDLAGYKRSGATEPMPRSLLLIDEFQEFFVEDDQVAQGASLLFDRIVRQGRAFGIHVLLGSQTLGGAYTLARTTLGQMAIRVALQCNEADAYLIMDDNNSAPRLLSRPGEGIYNDAAGAVEGNSPFQVVWLPDEERDQWLDRVRALAENAERERGRKRDEETEQDGRSPSSQPSPPSLYPSPIVFEGNAPADIRENDRLRLALETAPTAAPAAARCWLGAPNSIKGPTEAVFHRQSGNHLLLVGQREDAAMNLIGVSLLALAAQYPVGTAKFVVLHSANPETQEASFIEQVVATIPHDLTVAHGHDIPQMMSDLATELKNRAAAGEGARGEPSVFVFIHGLQKFKKLRHEDDFSFSSSDDDAPGNPGAQLNDLITDGSTHGLHLFVTVDTLNNVNRAMNRKAQSEFEMRVIFQMSANDSASLIDSPKAATLGLHRALLYNEQEGTLETFRPYAMPEAHWLREAGAKLAQR